MGNAREEAETPEKNTGEEELNTQEEFNFWASEVNQVKKCSKVDGRSVSYYGRKSLFSFVFFYWTRKWIGVVAESYLDPYKLHPLPEEDQILYWQPIFSKYVSDCLIELEREEYEAAQKGKSRGLRARKLILARAILFTFWKRILLATVGMVAMNIVSMSIAMLLSKLFRLMASKDFQFWSILGMVITIILAELLKGICIDHVTFYIQRLIVMVDYSLGITVFHHGLCLRRNFSNRDSSEYKCDSQVHACSGEGKCSDNPFLCSARRHKNIDISPKMYSYKFVDCYYVSLIFDNLTDIVTFLTNFIYGIILINVKMKLKIWHVFTVSISLVSVMVLVEVLNAFVLRFYYGMRDHRIGKSFEIITNFKLIRTLTLEDVADNIITDVRNDELTLVVYRMIVSLVNKVLYSVCVTCALLMIIKDFVEQLKGTSDVKSIDASTIITLLFIILKIIDPMYMIPVTLRILVIVINSYNRIEFFIRRCSPNYYQSDKFLTDPSVKSKMLTNRTLHIQKPEELQYLNRTLKSKRPSLMDGSVVKFEDASFSWIFTREDLLLENKVALLQNIDFTLARGEIVIVTGPQGSGKSNFLKAILGEMTLIGGSMAVAPLAKSMPIFYASQEVWLKRGSIRSNITFGHVYDPQIYAQVIKAIELETDIATWENGDLRVISDGGFALSGGQRVRVEFARAVYAYMVYSKVNREYALPGSFLMCLDSIFLGLDPFVGGNIFHNLFNAENGLLVKPDLSVVLTSSKRNLETFLSSSNPSHYGKVKMYTITKKTLLLRSDLKSFIVRARDQTKPREPKGKDSKAEVGQETLSSETQEEEVDQKKQLKLYNKCRSEDLGRTGRRSVVVGQYDYRTEYGCQKIEGHRNVQTIVFGPLFLYIKSTGRSFFFFMTFLVTCTVLDNMRYIFASKLSNFVNEKIKGLPETVDADEGQEVISLITEYSSKSFSLIAYLSLFVIITSVAVALLMTLVSFMASLKIHEYALDSSLYNSSDKVKIKRYLSDVITFLSCDTLFIDNALGYYLFDTFVLVVETIIHMVMLIYLVPTSVVFVLSACFLFISFPLLWFIKGISNIRFAYMASANRINCVLNDSISGSMVYRSYRKETELVAELVEHTDYNSRCRFMERAFYTWTSVTCRCVFSVMIFFIILIPLTISTISSYNIKIGYYGLAFSMSLNFINRFSKLLRVYTRLQLYMCSVKRFENFIPTNEKIVFKPSRNVYIEHLLVNSGLIQSGSREGGASTPATDRTQSLEGSCLSYELDVCTDYAKLKNKFIARRVREFYAYRKRMSIRSMFFKPKVNIMDVAEYLEPEHQYVRLDNVYVLCTSSKSLSENKPQSADNKSENTSQKQEHEEKREEEGEIKIVLQDTKEGEELLDLKNETIRKRLILTDINEQACKSNIIGLIGRTGAGKTTLLSVLLNIAKGRRGQVLLDGVELNQLPKELLRQIIGVLPQLPFVFRGWTIRRFLDPRKLFSDEKINEALEMCGLLEFVRGLAEQPLDLVILPDYYHKDMPKYLKRVYYPNTFVFRGKPKSKFRSRLSAVQPGSDADVILSNSQMRTLIFARLMLYRKFYRLILIDEPPSDNCSEDPPTPLATPRSSPREAGPEAGQIGLPIYRLLSEYFTHCTTFIAAHDANALKSCTRLWILNNGNLVTTCDKEQMLHDESLSKLIKDCVEN